MSTAIDFHALLQNHPPEAWPAILLQNGVNPRWGVWRIGHPTGANHEYIAWIDRSLEQAPAEMVNVSQGRYRSIIDHDAFTLWLCRQEHSRLPVLAGGQLAMFEATP